MVCSIGSGRMSVMSSLLVAESISQTIAEEVTLQKLAAQRFYRELRDADEANLLDEEDMHVFGLKPMVDPLQLVCCNACKKPVKASQYAAHAEICRSLNSMEGSILGVESGMDHKKRPRKDRKKLLTNHTNKSTTVGNESYAWISEEDTAVLESKLEGQIGTNSSFSTEAKTSAVTCMIDSYGVSPGNTDYSDSIMPPTKRSKLIAGEHLPSSDDVATSGVTRRMNTHNADTCRGLLGQSISGSELHINKCFLDYKKHGEVYTCCLPLRDVPVPLATKTYYSQRSNHLRSALTHLYWKASTKELYIDSTSPKVSEENMTLLLTSSQKDSLLEPMDDQLNQKRDKYSMPPVRKPDLTLGESSEVCLDKLGRSPRAMNSPSQVSVDDVSRPEIAPVGLIRSKYLLKPYSLAVN